VGKPWWKRWDGLPGNPVKPDSLHFRRPWLMSLLVALAVVTPAWVLLAAMGTTASGTAAAVAPIFLIWLVGGGVRRARAARRAAAG
jgi:hypothetical protein